MMRIRRCTIAGCVALSSAFIACGCRCSMGDYGPDAMHSASAHGAPAADSLMASQPGNTMSTVALANDVVQQASLETANTRRQPSGGATSELADPFAGNVELEMGLLVAEVLKRNASIPALLGSWQAAAERYPQVISLDDPMFGAMLGPASLGSNRVDFGWMVEGSQKLPWPGKRPLRGHIAQAQADAAFQDIEHARLRLAEAAKMAFLDFYLARREREINDDNVRIMREFRQIAQAKYEANQVTQQDVFQADVELADLGRRSIELDRVEQVAKARINTLLHRAPDHPLPAPVQQIDMTTGRLPPTETMGRLALARRPDLAAQAARIRAEEAAIELAAKEFYPDFEIVARYDAFWQPRERDLRPQIGVNLNLPIQRERRRAAVAEAVARFNQQRSELDKQIDEILYEVHAAVARLDEAHRIATLYSDSIVPAARQNVESAQAGYTAGRVDFLRLIEAQRQLIGFREKHYEATTEYHRRVAELERVLAEPVSGGQVVPEPRNGNHSTHATAALYSPDQSSPGYRSGTGTTFTEKPTWNARSQGQAKQPVNCATDSQASPFAGISNNSWHAVRCTR